MFGNWEININTTGMPQRIATACAKLNDSFGTEYAPIAYLGSQQVNGVNHAVLAEQRVLTGRDTKNVVLLIFNEKSEGVVLTGVERVVEGREEFGGMNIDVKTDIPEDAKGAFDSALGNFVGAAVKPFALLATQKTLDTSYVFAAESTPVALSNMASVAIVTVNAWTRQTSFIDMLASKNDALGYAFTWASKPENG